LKLNFEKAFDRIDHVAMLDIMEKRGFKAKWIFLDETNLQHGTSLVHLNDTLEKGVPL
jgi:hypothetical protein